LVREAWGRFLEANRGRFSLLLPVSMGAATLVYFALPCEPASWIGPAAMLMAAAVLAAGWRYPPARFAAFLFLAAALGFTRGEERTAAQPPLWHFAPGPAGVTGTITDILHLPGGDKIVLASPSIRHGPVQARTLHIRLRGDDPAVLSPGSRISVYAMLFGPERPAYPGAWDFGRQAYFDDLGASGFALGKVEIIQPAPPHAQFLQNLRGRIAAAILATLPSDTGSIAVTLLTGAEAQIPAQEHANFIAAGLAHILAVAGLHVGIVMGIFFFSSRFLLARSEWILLHLPVKAIAAMAALAGGAGYAALTGAHLPILRSLAMASLVTLGVLAGRRAISLRGLALAAFLLLAATPETILGVSFQMSFSAVLALIAGYAAAQTFFLKIHNKFLHHVLTLTFTSLLAGGASMPFAAYQFQQIEPYWIPANLIAVPLTALWIMPWGLAALALMPFGLASLALVPMGWGIAVIVWATTQVAAWPEALMSLPLIPASAILAYSTGLIWLCLWRTKIRLCSMAAFGLALWLAATARPPDVLVSADARLMAVRQGSKILLLRLPKASAYTLSEWAPMFYGRSVIQITCGPLGCPLGPVLLSMTPPASCGVATLVISPEPLRDACAALPRIDRLTTWQNGATAAWMTPLGPRLLTDRDVEGGRPWIMPWPEN
jgi:competence protein ComEC